MVRSRAALAAIVTLTLMLVAPALTATAQEHPSQYFHRTWERTDKPVADQVVSRTWMWGPDGLGSVNDEEYLEAPGGRRAVQYSDKTRMEINHNPGVSPDSVWYVTNGLLVKELITGQMQVGDNSFVSRQPAQVNVAGDFDAPRGVTYALMGLLLDDAPLNEGTTINWFLTPTAASNIYMFDDALNTYGVTAAQYVPETRHTVASPFWAFMNSSGIVYENGQFITAPLFLNPFYATGFPITEAYWADVKVGGTYVDVLIQCFERRCLTYTPSNDIAWQVEAGNVGLHYYEWRHGQAGQQPAPPPDPSQYQPWIYGISKQDVFDYAELWTIARGERCSQLPTTNLGTEIINCGGVWEGITYDYSVHIYGPSTTEVTQISVTVWNRSRGIQETDEIAREVLGTIAMIPYSDSQPDYSWQTISDHIREAGSFSVGSATFHLNDYLEGDLAWERQLTVVATGYVCDPVVTGFVCL